jgi:hypothetical protein
MEEPEKQKEPPRVQCKRMEPFVYSCDVIKNGKTLYSYECYSIRRSKCDFIQDMLQLLLDVQNKE